MSNISARGRQLFATQAPLILALLIIGGMLIAWKPWESTPSNTARTITVTGEAEITAEPDEYVFRPSYEYKFADKQTALTEATANTNKIVAELKKLGVASNKIKTDTSGGYRWYYDENQDTYFAYLTITVSDKDRAQKVQDYLLSTAPTGSVSPESSFSKAKQKELEHKGRDEATKDARAKAEQSAANLGFKIGKIKSVQDSQSPAGIYPAERGGITTMALDAKAEAGTSAPLQPGENDYSYSVTVSYYLR
jgi:uncharacterized protein